MLLGTAEMRRNERAARKWREARSPREAWRRSARWLKRNQSRKDHDDGDAPYAFDARRDFSMHTLFTGASAKRIISFEKTAIMHAFDSASYRVTHEVAHGDRHRSVGAIAARHRALIGEGCTRPRRGHPSESDSFLDVMPAVLGIAKRN